MKAIDPMMVKQAIKDGQLEVVLVKANIILRDVISGDAVKIGEIGLLRKESEPTISKDEPQTDYRITGTIGYRCPKCGRGNFLSEESNCFYCGEPLIKTKPQTDCARKKGE